MAANSTTNTPATPAGHASWADRRSSERFRYEIHQLVGPAEGSSEATVDPSYMPVKCNDISRGGLSFYWPTVPDFKELAFYLVRDEDCQVLATEFRHCRPAMLDGQEVFLVGCEFKTRLPELRMDEQIVLARKQQVAHRLGAASLLPIEPTETVAEEPQVGQIPVMIVQRSNDSLREYVECLTTAFPRDTILIPFEEPALALEYLADYHVDILVTDIPVDEGAGRELIATARRRNARAHLFMLTEDRTPESMLKALNVGVTDFLDKPFEHGKFVHAIRQAIEWQCQWHEDEPRD